MRKRQDPEQWIPDSTKADRDCTVLEIWSRYHQQIADFRRFAKPEDTTSAYTAALKKIEPALQRLPVARMSAYDCWDAVVSVRHRLSGMHQGEPYAASTFQTRMTILSDIFLFLESIRMCMGHERDDDQTRYDYAEPSVYHRMLVADHRMIDPSLRDDWITRVNSAPVEVTRTDVGTHYVQIAPGDQPLTVDIDVEAQEPGDTIFAELYRKLLDGVHMDVTAEEKPASAPAPKYRLNTDNQHWTPILRWPRDTDGEALEED